VGRSELFSLKFARNISRTKTKEGSQFFVTSTQSTNHTHIYIDPHHHTLLQTYLTFNMVCFSPRHCLSHSSVEEMNKSQNLAPNFTCYCLSARTLIEWLICFSLLFSSSYRRNRLPVRKTVSWSLILPLRHLRLQSMTFSHFVEKLRVCQCMYCALARSLPFSNKRIF
jgi:hypothetical protein